MECGQRKRRPKARSSDGIEVINRNDDNYSEVYEEIASVIYDYTLKSSEQIAILKGSAAELSDRADWTFHQILLRGL